MKAAFSRVLTLEVDGRPTLAFEASGTKQAPQLCQKSWLLYDLSFLTSGGTRLEIQAVGAAGLLPHSSRSLRAKLGPAERGRRIDSQRC
jgi:hypothetical protein